MSSGLFKDFFKEIKNTFNRFLSIFVASTILMIPSGFVLRINWRVTISSVEYGDRE